VTATTDLHLTDNQAQLLLAELDRIIENDRYPALAAHPGAARGPRAAEDSMGRRIAAGFN
jgi:hypothetical protein